MLSTSEGYPVLSADGAEIVLGQDANGEDYKTNLITIDTDGNLLYPDESNNPAPIGIKIGLYQFLILQDLIRLVEATFQRLRRQELHLTKSMMQLGRRVH